MPLLHEGAELVSGHIKSIEVGVQVEVLNLLNLKSDLSPGELFLLVGVESEVGVANLEDTASKGVGGNF